MLTRRNFLYASAGLSLSLVGCRSNKIDKRIGFYGTGTLDLDAKGWARLTREVGANIVFKDNGNDPGPVIAQMIQGSAAKAYQLGGLLAGAEGLLSSANTILPWNRDKIPNLTKSSWSLDQKSLKGDRLGIVNEKQFGIPLVVNADSMIYLPEKLRNIAGYENGIVDTYAAVFDPKLRGRTSMEDSWVNSVFFTALYLKKNNLFKIDNPADLSENELQNVMNFLTEKKKSGQFRKFWSGWEQGISLIKSGEVWCMTGWEPIQKQLVRDGFNAKYASPREGYEGWSINLLRHSSSNISSDLCHSVANWLLGGFYGSYLAAERGYVVPNDLTIAFATQNMSPIDSNRVVTTVNNVKEKLKNTEYWQTIRPANYELYEELWTRFRIS
jgi:putative spermidine/putrescine transport system substrate-binding protein